MDDIGQVLDNFYTAIDKDNNGFLSREEILAALAKTEEQKALLKKIQSFEKELYNDDFEGLDLDAFKKIARKAGIASGERFRWVRQSLNLDGRFSRLLKVGSPLDELSGIRQMSTTELNNVITKFGAELVHAFEAQRLLLNTPECAGPGQFEDVRSKFDGPVGKFGDTAMFQDGLESQLGNPDPFFLKGIFREHSSWQRELTSNYKINFSNEEEYARLFGNPSEYRRTDCRLKTDRLPLYEGSENIPIFLQEVARGLRFPIKGPSEAELRDLEDGFKRLRQIYEQACLKNNGVLPGEDGQVHKSVDVEIQALDLEELKRTLENLGKEFEEYQIFITPPRAEDATASPTGTGGKFNFSFYAPLCFYTKGKDSALISSLPSSKVRSSRVYIYIDAAHGDSGHKEAKLRKLLEGELFGVSELEQILCELAGQDGQATEKSIYIDKIVKVALSEQVSNIELLQARRRLSLQELMEVPQVKASGLRVEETVQVYQYTGPLLQVILSISFSKIDFQINVAEIDCRNGMEFCVVCPTLGRLQGTG